MKLIFWKLRLSLIMSILVGMGYLHLLSVFFKTPNAGSLKVVCSLGWDMLNN